MELSDIIPREPRGLYCDVCKVSMDLDFVDFSATVSGVDISITNLPQLHCAACNKYYLPDNSAFAVMLLHEQAIAQGSPAVTVRRKKRDADFHFTDVPFLIDADDYYYIPGLERPWDSGFLTPVFFRKEVLIKFDNSPDYTVEFASQTYGTIYTADHYFSFGINRHGRVVMWLGDIARLPESEQFYLRSENLPSDHSIGSEFYDAQIEAEFTKPTKEAAAIKARSAFAKAFEGKFGVALYHLDAELLETISGLAPPLVDTEKERKHVFDSLNRVFVEAIDNPGVAKLLKSLKVEAAGEGSLKRLQAALETADSSGAISKALSPFYVLYDLRVAYSHLTSTQTRQKLLSSAATRLSVPSASNLNDLYRALVDGLISSLVDLEKML